MLIESLLAWNQLDEALRIWVFRGGIIAIALYKLSSTRKITLNSNWRDVY